MDSQGRLFVPEAARRMYSIDSKDGHILWEIDSPKGLVSNTAMGADGTVYIGSNDNKLLALDPDTGKEKWHVDTEGTVNTDPVVGKNGTIYFGCNDGNVYAVAPEDGRVKRKFTKEEKIFGTSPPSFGTPLLTDDGMLYVGSNEKKLYALQDVEAKFYHMKGEHQSGDDAKPEIKEDGNFIDIDGVKLEVHKQNK
jgi:outer membrane protein assembly factor BamB